MLKVEYVGNFNGYGGISSYENNLYSNLLKFKTLKLIKNNPDKIFNIPLKLKKNLDVNLTHFTNQEIISPLIVRKKKFIVTVHDLIVKKMRLFSQSKNNFAFLGQKIYDFKLSCLKKAEKIIVVSNNTKSDLLQEFDFEEDKIIVIFEGVDDSFKNIGIRKYNNTLLYVGNELPHKNLNNLFKSLSIVRKTIPDIKLIKIGASGWKGAREELVYLAEKLNIKDCIIFKENVTNLAQEYNSATALVFPSLYEGFGLPLIEAMACGCPVIASNSSSIPEVAGDAASYFDPTDVESMAEKITHILSNEKLRKSFENKGLKRSKLFSWKKCAQETFNLYESINL